jgi:hypothetical protein
MVELTGYAEVVTALKDERLLQWQTRPARGRLGSGLRNRSGSAHIATRLGLLEQKKH